MRAAKKTFRLISFVREIKYLKLAIETHNLLFIWCFNSVDVWLFLSPAVIGTQRGWCSGYWDIRKGGTRGYRLLPLPFAYKGV